MYSTLMSSISSGSTVHPWDMFTSPASPILPREAPVFTLTKLAVPTSSTPPPPAPLAPGSNAWPSSKRPHVHCSSDSVLRDDGSDAYRVHDATARDWRPDDQGPYVCGPSKRAAVPAADGSGYTPYWISSKPPPSVPVSIGPPPSSAQTFGPPMNFTYHPVPSQNNAPHPHPSYRMETVTNSQGYMVVPLQSYVHPGAVGMYSRVEVQSAGWNPPPTSHSHSPSAPSYGKVTSDVKMSKIGVAHALAEMSGHGGSPGVPRVPASGIGAATTAAPDRKPRGPRKPKKPKRIMKTAYNCRQCGQLKKGHKCPNPDV